MTFTSIFLLLVAGIASAWAMHGLMLLISRRHEVPVNMVRAIGSFGTGRVDSRANNVGFALHTIGGAVLGLIYGTLIHFLGIETHPIIFFAGVVLGSFHGLVVCYTLMYYVAERHPVEAYRNATMTVGAIHLAGHIFFGLAVVTIIFLGHTVLQIQDGEGGSDVPRELRLDENPP